MFKYLNKFDIFYQHQYGFRLRHNTNQPLLHLINKIYENLYKYYGLKNVANTWFQNYLVNRTQYVYINGIFSKEKNNFMWWLPLPGKCSCERIKSQKLKSFYGLKIDEFLNWNYQAEHVFNKMASSIIALNQIKSILPLKICLY